MITFIIWILAQIILVIICLIIARFMLNRTLDDIETAKGHLWTAYDKFHRELNEINQLQEIDAINKMIKERLEVVRDDAIENITREIRTATDQCIEDHSDEIHQKIQAAYDAKMKSIKVDRAVAYTELDRAIPGIICADPAVVGRTAIACKERKVSYDRLKNFVFIPCRQVQPGQWVPVSFDRLEYARGGGSVVSYYWIQAYIFDEHCDLKRISYRFDPIYTRSATVDNIVDSFKRFDIKQTHSDVLKTMGIGGPAID